MRVYVDVWALCIGKLFGIRDENRSFVLSSTDVARMEIISREKKREKASDRKKEGKGREKNIGSCKRHFG